MLLIATTLFGLVLQAAAVAIGDAEADVALDARDPPTVYCEWYGYTGTAFMGTAIRQSRTTVCNKITDKRLNDDMFSAKVTQGGKVCLFSSTSGCSGSQVTIDTSGYRDMRALPAYYWYKCGAC